MQRDEGESGRPDPDALLREVEKAESPQGKLKVFLGYSPGVGKTYSMLMEARVRRRRGADIVVGSRYLAPGVFRAPLLKRIAVRFFGLIAGICIRQRVTDPTSGFKALNRRAMTYYVSDLLPISFPDADAMITAHRVGLRIGEVPVVMHARAEGRSMHDGVKGFLYFFNMLFSMFVSVLRKDAFNPGEGEHDARDAAEAEGVRGDRRGAVPGADCRHGQAPPP